MAERGEFELPVPVCKTTVRDLPLPPTSASALLVGGNDIIAPGEETVLTPDDYVRLLYRPEDWPFVDLIFGHPESD